MTRYVVERLAAHDRSGFASGVDALDRYLRERASQDARRNVANCFVAVEERTGEIAGFYTLAATSVPVGDCPADIVARLPRYPVLPAALIGRLAVDRRHRGVGLGGALLADAVRRTRASDVVAFAMIVDAKDETAVAFYRHHGFRSFVDRPRSLFLPLTSIR